MSLDVLQVHPEDNVAVAVRPLRAGTHVSCAGVDFDLTQDVRLGAKLALRPLAAGQRVIKYGEPIGTLTADVPLGGYVHTHNLESDYLHTWARGELLGPGPAAQPSAPSRETGPGHGDVPRPTYRPPR